MTQERTTRRLAAILAADVVGYGRLMERDEAGTLAALRLRHAQILDPLAAKHHGRLVKEMGDGVLLDFASAVNAVACAVEMQQRMAAADAGEAEDRRIRLRIGINLGDVVVEGGDLLGDGVIIAARLQVMAEPGGIWVSGAVHEQIGSKLDVGFEDQGLREIKNSSRPVRAFRVMPDGPVAEMPAGPRQAGLAIAVLPFANMSGDAGQQYFSDGITEDIITELARFRQLHVLARNSSFRYRGSDIDMLRAGRELGVAYLVEGSVRRMGERIRITAQLIDAATGHHVWAERFDRGEVEIFAVQDQVVRTIVATLTGRVQAAGAEGAKRKPPSSLAAYECVLRADALPFDDNSARAEARRLYERATVLDPGYARAYALLAINYNLERNRFGGDDDSLLDKSLEFARKAVALDENDSLSQTALGLIHLNRHSFDLAEHHYLKALALNRNWATLMASLGFLYGYLGKSEEAMGYFCEAKQLDPLYGSTWYWPALGTVHFIARRYDEAIEALSRSSSMPYWVEAYLAASHAMAGRLDQARHHGEQVMRKAPAFSRIQFAAIEPYKLAADRQHLLDGLSKAGLQ